MNIDAPIVLVMLLAVTMAAAAWFLLFRERDTPGGTVANGDDAVATAPALDPNKVVARYVRLEPSNPATGAWIHVDAMMAYDGDRYLAPVAGYPSLEQSWLQFYPLRRLRCGAVCDRGRT